MDVPVTNLDERNDALSAALETQRSGWALFVGVLVSLSSQIVLSLLGIGVGLSTGDRLLGGGFLAYWVILQLCCITAGAVIAGYLSGTKRMASGAILGALSWAIIVIFDVAFHRTGGIRDTAGGAWAGFFSSIFGLGLALVGGVIGVQLRHSARSVHIPLLHRRHESFRDPHETGPGVTPPLVPQP
jgi:hypothetical protein